MIGTCDAPEQYVASFNYIYNANDRLTREDDRLLGEEDASINYTLDPLDRVVGYTGPAGEFEYALDQVNNIRQKKVDGEDQEFEISDNGLNQVVGFPLDGLDLTLSYDDVGNLYRVTGQGVNRYFDWDAQGRLVEVGDWIGDEKDPIATYAYDAFGRRVRKVAIGKVTPPGSDPLPDEATAADAAASGKETVDYHLYGDNVVEELHQTLIQDQLSETLVVILHDPTAIDRYLAWDTYVAGEEEGWQLASRHLPVTDVRNNVTAVLAEQGDGELHVEADLTYDLHGKEANPGHGIDVPYRFSGRRYDPETGLYYYRSRYYTPEIGRFISVDSIGIWGDLGSYGNGYGYVGNRSGSYYDPTGEAAALVVVPVVIVGGIVVYACYVHVQSDSFKKGNEQVVRGLASLWAKAQLILAKKGWTRKTETDSDPDNPTKAEQKAKGDRKSSIKKNQKPPPKSPKHTKNKQKKKKGGQQGGSAPTPGVGDEEPEDDAEDDGSPSGGADPDGMTAPDSPGSPNTMTIEELLDSGRVEPEPREKSDSIEFYYDPRVLFEAKRHLLKMRRKKPIVGDDGQIHLPRPYGVAMPSYDWFFGSSLDPGVVDPVR